MSFSLRRINDKMTLSSTTVLIFVSLAVGMLFGLVRTQLINANFDTWLTGAYFSAFKIPEFILYTLGAGALGVALIPVLTDKLSENKRQEAWLLASSVINVMAIVMLILCLILVIFPEPILSKIIVPDFPAKRIDVAVQIMRLAAIGPLVSTVAYLLGSMQQSLERFFYHAIAPIFYNLSIIASIYLFKDSMGITCLGLGAAIGGILHLIIASLGMNRLKFRHAWIINFKDKSFRQVFKALLPRSCDQGIVYMNSIIQIRLASAIPAVQTVTNLENALMLYNAPITLLGVALGTAVFPKFSQHLSQNRADLLKKDFLKVFRAMIWISIPVIIVSYVCRDYLARLIFTRDNSEIAMIFSWLCIGILFRSLYAIISRFYYAQKDTLTPMLVTVVSFISNWILSWWLSNKYGVVGFGMATSLVAAIEIGILMLIIQIRNRGLMSMNFVFNLLPIFFIGFITLLISVYSVQIISIQANDNLLVLGVKLGLIASLILLIYFGISYALRIKEASRMLRYISSVLSKLSSVLYERKP